MSSCTTDPLLKAATGTRASPARIYSTTLSNLEQISKGVSATLAPGGNAHVTNTDCIKALSGHSRLGRAYGVDSCSRHGFHLRRQRQRELFVDRHRGGSDDPGAE